MARAGTRAQIVTINHRQKTVVLGFLCHAKLCLKEIVTKALLHLIFKNHYHMGSFSMSELASRCLTVLLCVHIQNVTSINRCFYGFRSSLYNCRLLPAFNQEFTPRLYCIPSPLLSIFRLLAPLSISHKWGFQCFHWTHINNDISVVFWSFLLRLLKNRLQNE